MEKKECPYCAEEIIKIAIKCKHCGEFLKEKTKSIKEKELLSDEKKEIESTNNNKRFFKTLLIMVFISFILKIAFNSSEGSGGEKKCPPVGTIKNSYYGHCDENFQKLLILKQSMNDPSSFEVVYTKQLNNGRLEVKYRGTNSFGATVTETRILY